MKIGSGNYQTIPAVHIVGNAYGPVGAVKDDRGRVFERLVEAEVAMELMSRIGCPRPFPSTTLSREIMMKSLFVIIACLLLASCESERVADEPQSMPDSELTGNRGQVLATHDVSRYTYIEVRSNGENIWLAGPSVDVKAGDVIRWGQYSVMRDFTSSELNRTFDTVLFVNAIVKDGQDAGGEAGASGGAKSGIVRSTQDAAGYTYVELTLADEQVAWLAAPQTALSVGDRVSWTGGSLMTDFRSSSLDRVFPEILFVQNLTTVEAD